MIEVSVNLSHPKFAGLPPQSVTVVVGNNSHSTPFFNFIPYPLNHQTVGQSGTNQRQFAVNGGRPLRFENADFALIGSLNANADSLLITRTMALLVDYVRKQILLVKKDGVTLTPEQLISYTP